MERAEETAEHPLGLVREFVLQLLQHGQVGIEEVERLLREVAKLEAGAQPHGAGVRREDTGDHLEQGRLAGTVAPGHGPAIAALDREVEVLIDSPRPVGLGDAAEDRHLVT